MNYTKNAITGASVVILFFSMCNFCTANEAKGENKPLILTIDTTQAAKFNATENNKHTFESTPSTKNNSKISKKIKGAKKALKKITTFKYRKNQKVKAKFTKSSYLLQYTHTL